MTDKREEENSESKKTENDSHNLTVAYCFFIHVAVGTVLFLLIGAVTIFLNYLITILVEDSFARKVFEYVKNFILILDCAVFINYLASSSYKMVKNLWKH